MEAGLEEVVRGWKERELERDGMEQGGKDDDLGTVVFV